MKNSKKRGFTLLLAALTASIVLSMGASIFLIAKKEVTLSSLGRDSQFAFYAADQAAECALYWDSRQSYFGTTTPAALVAPNDPTCDAQHWTPAGGSGRPASPVSYPYTMTFQYEPTSPNPSPPPASFSYCAVVTVEKCDGPIAVDGACSHAVPAVYHTTIHADGYSTSCSTLQTNPRALQRSVELHY